MMRFNRLSHGSLYWYEGPESIWLRMIIQKYNEKRPKLKRTSIRHVLEITAISSEYGNSAKIIVPRSWLGKRVIAFLHNFSEFNHLSF